jgi:fructose-1,6-bisphosphatase/inositol monophosphatase family enzyme
VRLDEADVKSLLQEVAETAVLPRHHRLVEGQVEEKSPGEIVTVADREAEVLLSAGLSRILPGVPVLGEEAASSDPALLGLLTTDERCWLIDPIDGTANFVAGSDDFAMMIALVDRGDTVAAWIHHPVSGTTYHAERGGGAYRDNERLVVTDAAKPLSQLSGIALTRFLSPRQKVAVEDASARMTHVAHGVAAAGIEYPRITTGTLDFALFWRTLPWDHAPGALLVTEAGGLAAYLDGQRYRPGWSQEGLLVAGGEACWTDVQQALDFDS